MKELKYVEKIRTEDALLSMPQSLSQILNVINTDDFSMDDLAEIIMGDPGLTGKVLKMANSAFYRHQARIGTVHQAVMMLGVTQVKCLALSSSVFRMELFQHKFGVDIKDMFGHFISVALGCRMLAEAAEFPDPEEAFIAGLLHDIGLVFFLHHFPGDYTEVIQNYEKYPGLTEAETEILGIDHAEIGRLLAEKWNFPPSLCEAIGQHHKVADTVDPVRVVHLVQLSRLINKPVIDDRPQNMEHRLGAVAQLCALMRIDRKKIDEISFSLLAETLAIAEHLGIDVGDPTEVLMRANKELFNSYLTIENLVRERQELSRRILAEERRAAMLETKNIAIATLSHYINNAAMSISGRGQLIKMLIKNGTVVD
ncbi:MAG: HDOD domain-containing protein, partial [Candidatus Thorarchaeota archaeon]